MNRTTISNVQLLRFVAASGVLFSHTADLLLPRSSMVWAIPWNAGVDLFFVISGFIMTWLTQGQFGEPGAGPRYLLRRTIRIVPPYWFFTGLMILTVLVFSEHVRNTTVGPLEVVTSFAFVPWPRHDGGLNPIISQGWTLNYEAFFYVCFAVALGSRRGLSLLVAAFVLVVALHPLVPEAWFVPRFYTEPIILEFVGGIAIARLYLGGMRLSRSATLACGGAAIAFYILAAMAGITERAVLFGLPALLVAGALILAPEPSRQGAVMGFMIMGGNASYTLYLSHTFTVNAVVLLWRAAGGAWPLVALFAAMAIAIAVAMLFYRFAEAPLTGLLGRRLQSPVERGPASVAP